MALPGTLLIDPTKPSMQGIGFLGEEFANRVTVQVRREAIDWEQTLWEGWGWRPHDKQRVILRAAFEQRCKVIVVRAGKRSGKTQAAIAVARTVLKKVPGARVWCASKVYDLADRVFDLLWADCMAGKYANVTDKSRKERRVRMEGGSLVQAKSWDDPETLEGESLDVVIGDEAQSLDEERFNRLYARTVDRGGVLFLIGSAMSSDLYFLGLCEEAKSNPNWLYLEWTLWDNPYAPQEEIRQAQDDLSEEAFGELFENKTRMPRGLVFSDYYDPIQSSHNREPNPKLPMQVWIDPGTTASAYAIAFAQIYDTQAGPAVRLYDEIYEHHTTTEDVIYIARQTPWWPQVTKGVMDIAGRTRHDRKKSPKEIWQELARIPIHDQKVDILPGIDRHRNFLLQKATGLRRLFSHVRMANTHMEYRTWRFPKRGENMSAAHNPIDAFNHIMKAINYGLVHNFGYFDRQQRRDPTQSKARVL